VSREIVNSKAYNLRQKTRANKILVMQRNNDIISMLLDGKDPKKEIAPYIINKYNVNHASVKVLLSEARGIIKERNAYQLQNLISLHISRYETIYNELFNLSMFGDACNVLEAKEKLLGFHKEGFHMKVSQGEISQVQLQTVDSDYNISKLEVGKQERLNFLLNKAKR
jgi:hypothetical protein